MKRKSLRTILLAFMFSMLPMLLEAQQEKRPQPGTKLTDEQIKQWVAPMRAGRKLTPKSWPNGAKVAVCLSWDMDNETFEIAAGHSAPVLLSQGEYGFTEGLPRIMALYDKYNIPGSFYIPAVTGVLYPAMIQEFKRRPRHEIGIHGWIHERLTDLDDQAEEERLLNKAIEFWTSRMSCFPTAGQPAWSNCRLIGFLTTTRTSFPAAHSRRRNSFLRFIRMNSTARIRRAQCSC